MFLLRPVLKLIATLLLTSIATLVLKKKMVHPDENDRDVQCTAQHKSEEPLRIEDPTPANSKCYIK